MALQRSGQSTSITSSQITSSQIPSTPRTTILRQAASSRQEWVAACRDVWERPTGVVPPLPVCPEGVNPLFALVAGLEMYTRLLLVRQDAERTRLAGVQADLVSIHNAMLRQRDNQHDQHVDVMRRLSRCRLSQIGFACTNASHQGSTTPFADPKAPPVQPPPPVQPAVRPRAPAQRPRGTVANQCPIWFPQSCSSSSSSSAAIADDGAAAAASCSSPNSVHYWRMQQQLERQRRMQQEANAAAAPPGALPAALVAELTADLPLLAALPAVLPITAPVTPDPELEPEPGSSSG